MGGTLERLLDWPERRIADPAFRRWAQSFWLTRWIARRRAKALFDLVAGFVYSQTLLACVQLRLFDRLSERAQTADELATALRLPPDGAGRLLDAAVALRLLRRRAGGRYALGRLGAAMVSNEAVAAMVTHHSALYADLRDPLALLHGARRGALAGFWPYATSAAPQELSSAAVSTYSALMSASQPLVADVVLDAYPLAGHRCLLDVGGGEGGFLMAAGGRQPALHLLLFELPAVAAKARGQLDALGFGARARCVAGNFLQDPLPTGADVISLVRVVHDHDDAGARRLLRAVFDALPAGGTLLLAEPMAGTPGAESMGDAYFGWYLLAMGRGRPRSAAALEALLREAGFGRVRLRPTSMPLQTGLLVAERIA